MSNPVTYSANEDTALDAALAAWRRTVEAELKGASMEKKLHTRTFEGITLKPLYTRADKVNEGGAVAVAGQSPFVRGTRASGYAERRWEVAQEIAAETPEAFNRALRADLMAGQDAAVVWVASAVRPEGLKLTGPEGLAAALQGVDLSVLPVHLGAGVADAWVGEAFLGEAKKQGVEGVKLRGSVTLDPMAEWAAGGGLPMSWEEAGEGLAKWTVQAAEAAPELKTIGVDARMWAEAGGTAVHELACGLATTVEYLRALGARGVGLETSVPRLRVTLSAGPQFLMETAKFRAWRPLLARVVVALGGEAGWVGQAGLYAATAEWNKTRLDAHVNLLRVTTEGLSAVLGGVDGLHVGPFDGMAGASEFSRRIARNVHTLLGEEFGLTMPADPAGGSWCVENLTEELGRKAWALFQRFEAQGGFAAALRAGEPQRLVAEAAAEKTKAVGTRRLGVVGTNLFPNLRETPLRKKACAAVAIGGAEERIEAVKPFRVAAGFERMRDATAAFAKETGSRPKVFLARMGPVGQHKARADFAAGFFAPGGLEVVSPKAFETAREAAEAALAAGAQVAVLCSTDETYAELVPEFAGMLREAKRGTTVVLAGWPAEEATREAFSEAGIELFIHLRAPVEETLNALLEKIGVLK